jgi:peptide deformylase
VIQHEIDHLNGLLFVDHVRDTTTYMTLSEYRKRIVQAD